MAQRTATSLVHVSSTHTFTVQDQHYAIVRFQDGKAPRNLAELIRFTEGMEGEMLTKTEAVEIRDTPELNTKFKGALAPGEWTYVHDPESKERPRAAYLLHYGSDG